MRLFNISIESIQVSYIIFNRIKEYLDQHWTFIHDIIFFIILILPNDKLDLFYYSFELLVYIHNDQLFILIFDHSINYQLFFTWAP